VAYLLEQGADVNKTFNGWTALMESADEGAMESMFLLLQAGAAVNYHWTTQGPTAISMAASEGKLNCLKLLLEYGADINGAGNSVPPLHIAAEESRLEVIDYLISQNVTIDKRDAGGRTALMYAASEGNRRSVVKLISAGANISISDNEGAIARTYAEEEGHHNILKYLGANKSKSEESSSIINDKNSSIHKATREGYIEKVQRLVAKGTDVNAVDEYERTPLHISAALGHNIDMRARFRCRCQCSRPSKSDASDVCSSRW